MCIHYNILITQKHLNRSFLKWVRRRENLRIQITIIGFSPPNFLSVGRKQTLKEVPFLVRTARALPLTTSAPTSRSGSSASGSR